MSAKEWYHIELPLQYVELFKYYLRENDIYFEPSEANYLVHLSCHMTVEDCEKANEFVKLIKGAANHA